MLHKCLFLCAGGHLNQVVVLHLRLNRPVIFIIINVVFYFFDFWTYSWLDKRRRHSGEHADYLMDALHFKGDVLPANMANLIDIITHLLKNKKHKKLHDGLHHQHLQLTPVRLPKEVLVIGKTCKLQENQNFS